jgi:hypothetical protein
MRRRRTRAGGTEVVEFTWGEYLASLPAAAERSLAHGGSWTDFETFDSALRKMTHGDDAYAAMADELLDKLADLSEGAPVREWAPGAIGAYCVVPEAIMGLPQCMRQLAPAGELSPVKIVISSTCSAGVDKRVMTERGVAILALLQKLQAIRAVELYILVEGNEGGAGNLFQMIRVDTKPLSVAHACFALANVGFARGLTYAHMHHYHGWNGSWPAEYGRAGYNALVREAVDMTPEDLWIPSSYMTDSLLSRDPVAWVNRHLARFSGGEVE